MTVILCTLERKLYVLQFYYAHFYGYLYFKRLLEGMLFFSSVVPHLLLFFFFAYYLNFNYWKRDLKRLSAYSTLYTFKTRMLNFKIGLIFLLKELIYVCWALQACLMTELFLENIKKENCKLCEDFIGLVWKNT